MKIERALVLLQRVDQRVDARHVEVRRRLVHEQQVGRIEQQLDQAEARFFAAREDADFLEGVVALEEERAENGARGHFGHRIRNAHHLLQNRAGRVEHVDAVLRVVADLDVVAELALALLDFQTCRREFSAASICPRRSARRARCAGPSRSRDRCRDRPRACRRRNGPCSSVITRWPLRTGCGNLMWMFLVGRFGRLDFFHALDLLELALRLRGLAGLGAETVGEFLQLRDFGLLVFVGGEMLLLRAPCAARRSRRNCRGSDGPACCGSRRCCRRAH